MASCTVAHPKYLPVLAQLGEEEEEEEEEGEEEEEEEPWTLALILSCFLQVFMAFLFLSGVAFLTVVSKVVPRLILNLLLKFTRLFRIGSLLCDRHNPLCFFLDDQNLIRRRWLFSRRRFFEIANSCLICCSRNHSRCCCRRRRKSRDRLLDFAEAPITAAAAVIPVIPSSKPIELHCDTSFPRSEVDNESCHDTGPDDDATSERQVAECVTKFSDKIMNHNNSNDDEDEDDENSISQEDSSDLLVDRYTYHVNPLAGELGSDFVSEDGSKNIAEVSVQHSIDHSIGIIDNSNQESELIFPVHADVLENMNDVQELVNALEAERKHSQSLYRELEKERNAAAEAANEVIAMISRLQEEKAALCLEATHFQRIVEEEAVYDQEAINSLKEDILKRETEKIVLEKEVEVYKGKLLRGNWKSYQICFSGEKMVLLAKGEDEPVLEEEDEEDKEGEDGEEAPLEENCIPRDLPINEEVLSDRKSMPESNWNASPAVISAAEHRREMQTLASRLQALEADHEMMRNTITTLKKEREEMGKMNQKLQSLQARETQPKAPSKRDKPTENPAVKRNKGVA